ncbi:MAG: histidine kinase [Bacteroidales bacterium]|nr:histidine kinase [Bacteroidales bacterium]
MNNFKTNTRTLFKMAMQTSPVIAILSISPIFIIRTLQLLIFPKAVLMITFVVFFIWCINIFTIKLLENYKLFKNKRFVNYFFSYIFTAFFFVILFVFFRYFFSKIGSIPNVKPIHSPLAAVIMVFSINTVIFILINLVMLKEKKAKVEIENTQLKMKTGEAQNQLLKQQIHPHFLFNSLNTLKSLIKKSPELAEDYLIKLSDFLRISVTSNTNNLLKIKDELKICDDYLQMQKIRFGNALKFSFDIPENIYNSGFLPVFSIQLLIENAIKHNILTEEKPLQITISYNNDRIIVTNNFQPKNNNETVSGIGLTNLAERYKLISSDDIIIHTDNNFFTVSIKILKNENSNN